jgi:carbon monoxide dehydrogenase subunit G
MGIEKYVSEPRELVYTPEQVFAKLSNLKNLEQFISSDKIDELNKKGVDTKGFKLEDFAATEDRCSFKISPVGKVGIEIVEREPHKTIKFQGEKSVPFPVTFWVQLVPLPDNGCKMRLTLHADLNPMIKMMVGGYLEKGIEKLADMLCEVEYQK